MAAPIALLQGGGHHDHRFERVKIHRRLFYSGHISDDVEMAEGVKAAWPVRARPTTQTRRHYVEKYAQASGPTTVGVPAAGHGQSRPQKAETLLTTWTCKGPSAFAALGAVLLTACRGRSGVCGLRVFGLLPKPRCRRVSKMGRPGSAVLRLELVAPDVSCIDQTSLEARALPSVRKGLQRLDG